MGTLMLNNGWMSIANMFREMEALLDYDFNLQSKGLKRLISRPHNLLTKYDDKGNVTSFEILVVYTPFKKDEVKVEVANSILSVKCGQTNKQKDDGMDYCGISNQSYQFSIPLNDCIDTKKIEAKAEDGILKIILPLKATKEKKEDLILIDVK